MVEEAHKNMTEVLRDGSHNVHNVPHRRPNHQRSNGHKQALFLQELLPCTNTAHIMDSSCLSTLTNLGNDLGAERKTSAYQLFFQCILPMVLTQPS